ncbi:hypothetical protein V1272_001125 [Bradyrhizobium sp. AZCC 1708]
MTETVKAFPEYGPKFFPLPHPSWRSGIWMQRQPWFEQEVYLSSDGLCGAHSRIEAVKAPVGHGNEHADPLTDMLQRV